MRYYWAIARELPPGDIMLMTGDCEKWNHVPSPITRLHEILIVVSSQKELFEALVALDLAIITPPE